MSAGTTLKKKVGPLPVWVWGAAVAAGILIYYLRNSSTGPVTGGAARATATPTLDPTEGAFDMPSGLSSGGFTPDNPVLSSQDIADAVSSQLAPILATLPYASVPGEPSAPVNGIDDVIDTITKLQSAGLLNTTPAASTGAATSKPQAHTQPKPPAQRVNKQAGNPRAGQVYRTVTNPKGKEKGTYHVYGKGKTARYIRVKK